MKSRYKSRKRRPGSCKHTRSRKTKSIRSMEPNRKHYLMIPVFIGIIIALYYIAPDCITFEVGINDMKKQEIKDVVEEVLDEKGLNTSSNEQQAENNTQTDTQEEQLQPEQTAVTSRSGSTTRAETQKVDNSLQGYKLTSYHPGDGCLSTNKTGSGLTTNDFKTMKIGNKSVYTYKGKIVVACATNELKKAGYSVRGAQQEQTKHYFNYFDELKIKIDGQLYDAICLDSCGAAMWKGQYRIDIYVPTSSDVINRSNVTAYYNI